MLSTIIVYYCNYNSIVTKEKTTINHSPLITLFKMTVCNLKTLPRLTWLTLS